MDDNFNVISGFFKTAERQTGLTCAHFEVGGKWRTRTWSEVASDVRNVAANLIGMGLQKGDRVLIFAKTRYEWALADMAIMAAGGIVVPVYHTYNAARAFHIIEDSRPSFAVVEDQALFGVLDQAVDRAKYPSPIKFVSMEPLPGIRSIQELSSDVPEGSSKALSERVASISHSDVATYVYTSGTTGELKGVVLTHGNLAFQIRADEAAFLFGPDEIGLLWLPLAHVLGRMMEIFSLVHGCQTAFANDIGRLPEIYKAVRPHFVCGVPRMLEKVYESATAHIRSRNVVSRAVFKWALLQGEKRAALAQKKLGIPLWLRCSCFVADVLAFRRLRMGLGGRLYCYVCGGAKLSPEIAKFFCSCGITVLEGYGLTETFAAATVNRFDDLRFGTVGKPLPYLEFSIAADGEVLIKGPTVFREYLNLPEETKRSFDRNGYFLTGDIGEFTRDGFLRITGRKKDIIITAGGKNIAPQLIENLMMESPYMKYFVAYGEAKRYLVGLVVPDETSIRSYLKKHGTVDESRPLSEEPLAVSLIAKEIEARNSRLASFETVKRFAMVDGDFSIDSGELTPTMKVRRQAVIEKYRDRLEALYR